MLGVKFPLMVASQTLLNIPGQVSGVRVMCRGSKSGQTDLFLDARMLSVELQKSENLLKISWTTSKPLGKATNLKNPATYQVSILLSTEDQNFEYFRHNKGDYLVSDTGSLYMLEGLVLTEASSLVYLLSDQHKKYKRFISQDSLEQGYSKIQTNSARFLLIGQ